MFEVGECNVASQCEPVWWTIVKLHLTFERNLLPLQLKRACAQGLLQLKFALTTSQTLGTCTHPPPPPPPPPAPLDTPFLPKRPLLSAAAQSVTRMPSAAHLQAVPLSIRLRRAQCSCCQNESCNGRQCWDRNAVLRYGLTRYSSCKVGRRLR